MNASSAKARALAGEDVANASEGGAASVDPTATATRLVVDVLPHLRTAKFDRALTYAVPNGLLLAVGEVVRAPLGSREVYGYVVGEPRLVPIDGSGRLRALAGKVDAPRAFDAAGLRLAEFIAERYCCSLGEALASIVFAGAIPRAVDRLVPSAERPNPTRFPSIPPRLIALIWEDLAAGFGLETLLRHPDARRAGDRRTLLRAVSALVRAGVLLRERTFESPRMREAQERVLEVGERDVRGPRVRALVDLVRESGRLRRADALLAGFSAAVIQVLSELGVKFKSFDVLTDPSLRQGIKEFSQWPTIPQLYVKGEFIGGCDIVREMHASGELREAFSTRGIQTQAA